MEEKKKAEKNKKNKSKRISKHKFPYNPELNTFTSPKTQKTFIMLEIVKDNGVSKKKNTYAIIA